MFPTMDRHLTLIEGRGIVLRAASGSMRLARVGDGVAFPGEQVLNGELIDGPVRVWNVMTRRGTVTASIHVHRNPPAALYAYDVALVIAGEFAWHSPGGHEEIAGTGEGICAVTAVDAPALQPLCKLSQLLCTVIHTAVTQL